MKKSDIPNLPTSHLNYILQIEDIHYLKALSQSLDALENAPREKWESIGDLVYSPGKWTIKDLLQHLIDCERVFVYRASAYARGEKRALLPFDEDDYAAQALAKNRTLNELIEELIIVRRGSIALFNSFTPKMLLTSGTAYDGTDIFVLSVAFIIAGHQKWHFNIIEERYFPLVNN
jgi:hypothetical protein